jgi:peptidoglycan hydrolase-like protein with peptidoglycan-binding domain
MWFQRTIFSGDFGEDVRVVQRKLGMEPTGWYDNSTRERVIGMARKNGIETNGEVNADVAGALGESEANASGLAPQWFERELSKGDEGKDVAWLRGRLGLDRESGVFDEETADGVRRFQSYHRLTPTGRVDEFLARLLG